ncbi:MAG: hypothetical protein M3Z25_14420 [Actinomycetota bacterium]|nr:hypothetical protein [Actinomycetota bacterium]
MPRRITQRELRNETPAIMRAVENGESFVLTRKRHPDRRHRPARSR